ncbi:hypothetical protein BIZ78_gp227 [Erwinia phage vB_EamM_Caitlin]|uniref:hypothetical protein n=1 Tax=Erwinia phage vB_EamM_Caitlin TaxID=1883379 RepID=UPI00081CAB88|nr:hypothetical protein BIZ78_gp227 [Erwinia phage vB_EamM_Caitlin]ANZ48348.1 hypothetical protein CAITLIN_53 [Erwinia phage vB_EamM_Caitlin]
MSEVVKDESTQDVRPVAAVRATAPAYGQEDQGKVQLVIEMLDEAGAAVGRNKKPKAELESAAYSKLHSAFRNLFQLRGQPFLDGFAAFVSAAVKHQNGIFYTPLATAHMDNFNNRNERETFMIFIHMVIRFARCQNKANFSSENNVERLAARVVDPELQQLLRHAFLAA